MSALAGMSTIRDTMIYTRGPPVTLPEIFVHRSNLSAFFNPRLWWNPNPSAVCPRAEFIVYYYSK
jgi:hypothetical protein